MYQITCLFEWRSREAGDEAHATLLLRALDRWEELAPEGAKVYVARCSDTQTIWTSLFPTSDGITEDPKRNRSRSIVLAIAKDFMGQSEPVIMEGPVVESRVRG